MTVTLKYSLMACAFLLGGCSSSVSPGAGTPLAEVNGSFLYEEDVDRVMPVGLHGADSVNFVQQYVRDWVEDALLYKKAKDNVPDNQRIEELVSSYRKTLIMHTYQEELVKQKLSGAITDAEVEQAARQAEIYDDICAMPDGFDTYVGERGALLSGGQKQRVAIARVFLKAPPILILDEATSALDSVTEARIQGAFDRLARGRTTLIIAHRLSTIRSAGRILVIQDGVVAEQGSHQELLAKNGVYATLYRTQNLGA